MSSPLQCPITLEVMKDPVLAPDGYTYERKAIVEWLQKHGTSPQTRERMSVGSLVPNRALRDLLEQQKETPGSKATADAAIAYTAVAVANAAAEDEKNTYVAKPCSKELYKSISEMTKASIHLNTHNKSQSIVHIDTPSLTDNNDTSFHICCVIDISGSMAARARCKDENGLENRTGLNILDVVKFATLVICKSLNAKDKLSIVTYSTEAEVKLEPTFMDAEGKKRVASILSSIMPMNQTNLWDGMKKGLQLASDLGQDYINSIFVLTDGVPNIDPPIGYERSLKKLLNKTPLFGTVSTFGFGYNLESQLLANIAKIGEGYYSFIPDSGFVGTCFINSVANARCAFGLNPYLRIKRTSSSLGTMKKFTSSNDHYVIEEEDGENIAMKLTPLRYGTSIDILINHDEMKQDDGGIDLELVFYVVGGQEVCIPVQDLKIVNDIDLVGKLMTGLHLSPHKPASGKNDLEVSDMFHTIRDGFIKTCFEVTSAPTHKRHMTKIFELSKDTQNYRGKSNDLDALCKDIEGQATEAVSTQDYYDRWGRHYLLSLHGAHLHQFCNNFKDPGVQVYGQGELFIKLQEDLNDIFETIPAPKGKASRYWKNGKAPSMARAFNNKNAVCVHGHTKITVKCQNSENDVVVVSISSIKKGDLVLTEDGDYAKVLCLVETVTQTPLDLVQINTLQITPYHPVKISTSSSWEFPINCSDIKLIKNDSCSVFNLVLEKNDRHKAIMMEDSIASITLGHGIRNDDVLKHDYFGTDRVVQDLENFGAQWLAGHIKLNENDVKRENHSGDICGITQLQSYPGMTHHSKLQLCES